MKRTILLMIMALSLLAVSCRKDGVIPRSDMSKIYAELFMVDQWLETHQSYYAAADTSVVYAEVFEKYGYTSDEFFRSVNYYVLDPERFEKMLKESRNILEKRLDVINKEILAEESERRIEEREDSLLRAMAPIKFLASVKDTSCRHRLDSTGMICVYIDSTGWKIFDRDTLAGTGLILDSLKVLDK